jgi:hypothetical protein
MEKTYCWKEIPEAERCQERHCNSYRYCVMKWAEWLIYTLQDKNAKIRNTTDQWKGGDGVKWDI